MTRLFYVIFLPLFLILGALYSIWLDNIMAHTPREVHQCRLEALLEEFVSQTDRMEKTTDDLDYDEAAIRAWVTFQAISDTYAKMGPCEMDQFFSRTEILPSPRNKYGRCVLFDSTINRSTVRSDFSHWIKFAGIGSDSLTVSPLYESARGIQIEEEQRVKLNWKGLVDIPEPER